MTDQTQISNEGVLVITNIDQLAFVVANWFDNGQQQVKQLLEVPDGQDVTVTFDKDAQPEKLVLTGDMLKGFKAGVIAVASIFNDLPFGRTMPEEAQPEATKGEGYSTYEDGLKLVASNDDRELAEKLSGHDGDDAASRD